MAAGDLDMTLDDMIGHLGAKDHPRPEELAIIKTLEFMKKWEPEIRAALPGWKLAREDPAVRTIVDAFPGSKMTVRDASE
jgi:hypothetical protein